MSPGEPTAGRLLDEVEHPIDSYSATTASIHLLFCANTSATMMLEPLEAPRGRQTDSGKNGIPPPTPVPVPIAEYIEGAIFFI